MRKRFFLLANLLLLLIPAPSVFAFEVLEAAVTTGISERKPIDAIQSFSVEVDQLYCFTRIGGAEEETSVTHVWYHGDQEMARITLPVRSADWRTWSSKTILPQWTGDWRVEIEDPAGEVLKIISFTLLGE